MSKLDDRIKEDLKGLYDGTGMKRAHRLSQKLKIKISAKGEPAHFFGNRKANTVVVMLNPGSSCEIAEANMKEFFEKCKCKSLKGFIDSYMDHKAKAAGRCPECCRYDAFDVKQAAFLKRWVGNGIILPASFASEKEKLLAKKNVLLQKLQLELVPFASRTFTPKNKKEFKALLPYLEDCIDEIFAKKRKYVIFCGRVFEQLLKMFNEGDKARVSLSKKKSKQLQNFKGYSSVAYIRYKGKTQKALIAHTFASHALSNAFDLMEIYGKNCYENFKSN